MIQKGNYSWSEKDFLGEGSYGKVYKGKNIRTGEVVAVKCMDMDVINEDEFLVQSLEIEISIMRVLKSQNAVRLFDVFKEPKTTFIILEMCGDGDLLKFLKKNGGMLEEKLAINILQQLMYGFKDLADNGYIHRDIKPANALVKGNIFKVADFGFACKADLKGKELITDCVGTPLYMAPQLLEEKPYTAKSDIWSIGMMFYEMLFGKTPWPARDLHSFLENMQNTPIRFPYEKPVTDVTKDFITKALQVDEYKRISWAEIFKHPILQAPEKGVIQQPTVKLDAAGQEVLRRVQNMCQLNNVNLFEEFKKFDRMHSGLREVDFYHFLQDIDKRVTSYEAQHVFKALDDSGDGYISFEEFKKFFLNTDFSNLKDRASNIITELKEVVKANNIKIKEVFKNFDVDASGKLDRKEFAQLIRIIAPDISDDDISEIFVKFDVNKDGDVSFEEFQKQMAYGIDDDVEDDADGEKGRKLIQFIKEIIRQNNLNLMDIFKNFDTSGDGKLDSHEFTQLLRVIDDQIPLAEARVVYSLFDNDNDGQITFAEFQAALR